MLSGYPCPWFITKIFIPMTWLLYLCQRSQVSTAAADNGKNRNDALSLKNNLTWLSQHREIAPSAFKENVLVPNGSDSVKRTHKCCAYIANKSKYCARLNSIQAFSDINRDVRYMHAMLFIFYSSFYIFVCSNLIHLLSWSNKLRW